MNDQGVVFTLTYDAAGCIKGAAEADEAQKKLQTSVKQFSVESTNAYNQAGKAAKKYGDETNKAFDNPIQKLNDLKQKINELKNLRATAETEEGFNDLNKQIVLTELEIKTLETNLKNGFTTPVPKIEGLRSQLKNMKADLANATDPKEIIRLAKAAGALADQIGDASDAASIFATDSPFEAVGNGIGSVAMKLRNLDFAGAAQQSKLLLAASKQITFAESMTGLKQLGTTLLNVGTALLTNPLFLIGGLVMAIVSNFDKLKASGGAVGAVFKFVGDVFSGLSLMLQDLSDMILKTSFGLERMNQIKIDVFSRQLTREVAALDNFIKVVGAAGKSTVDAEIQKQKAIRETSVLQLGLLHELAKTGKTLTDEQKKQGEELRVAAINANAEIMAIEQKEKKRKADEAKKASDDRKRLAEELAAALLDLARRSDKAISESLTGVQRLDALRVIQEKELDQFKAMLKKKGEATNKNFKFTAEQEQQFANLKLGINREYYDGLLNLSIQQAQQEAAVDKQRVDNKIANLELQNTIIKNGINTVKAVEGATNLEREMLEQQRTEALLNQEKKYQADRLQLTIDGIDAESNVKRAALNGELALLQGRNDVLSSARRDAIDAELKNITVNSNLAKEAAVTGTANIIGGIEQSLTKLQKEKAITGMKIDWAKIFGVSDAELQVIKNNLQTLGSEVLKIANMTLDFQEQALNKEMEASAAKRELFEKEIGDLESKLEAEQKLKDDGFANDTVRLEEDLANKKKQREEQIKEEKRIKDEQEKLARERILLQQAMQGANLATAISEIFASTAALGPLGVGIGALAAAALIGSFAYSQGQISAQLNKSDNSFAKGVIDLQGPGTGTSDSIPSNLSKGESVMTAEETKDNKELFLGIRKRDDRLIQKGIMSLLKNTGVTLQGMPKELLQTQSNLKQAELSVLSYSNNSGMEKRLDITNRNIEDFIRSQKGETMTVLQDGRIVIQRNNLTRIIKPQSSKS